ncbi:HAD family hydrolase, partial [Candidatus Bathyarchaeota archaeon]|nr:HAD family hydrolase [Candidatus Bathyarchaeota archaeon]
TEALNNLGFEVTMNDCRVKDALNVFFQDFIDTLELRNGAKKLIHQAKEQGKVGLISNFTHAPVIHKSLRKVGIDELFDVIVVSEEVGWRKPSTHIFQDALNRLQVQACEAVYIGDSPIEDIKGAKQSGLKTVFVPSQFNSLKDLFESKQEPDFIAKDLTTISLNLKQAITF